MLTRPLNIKENANNPRTKLTKSKKIKSIQEYHILYILNIYEYTFKNEIKKAEINVDKASKY